MQPQKCSLKLYSDFLLANHNRYSGAELARVSPVAGMSHDAVSRWLGRSSFTPSDLWNQVKDLVRPAIGYLVCDDTVLDKSYSRKNELAKLQYSGNAHGLVNGINLVNLLWTNGQEYIPVDYRIYQKANDDNTKNDHFLAMLKRAKQRGFSPLYVLIDSWYSSVANLKYICREARWQWITNLKSNRQVSVDKGIYTAIADLDLTEKQVRKVWLKEYGFILVCLIVDQDGGKTYLATSDLALSDYDSFTNHFHHRWAVEEFHRGIKQTTGIEKCYSTKAASQKTHIFTAFVTFIRLERIRLKEQVSWYEQKAIISRKAAFSYLCGANA